MIYKHRSSSTWLPTARLSRRAALGAAGAATLAARPSGNRRYATAAQDATPAASDGDAFSTEEQLALTGIVADGLAATSTPGALVGVWYPGRGTWMHAAGIGDLTTAAPVSVDDHVRIASITKTFAATVVLQLVDEGALGLDDRMDQYISGIPNGETITLRQVLGMTAGVYDFVADPTVAIDYDRDPLLPFTPDQAVEIVRQNPPDFDPGARVQYSNSNYVLLGLIIEQITGTTAAAAITDRIITPLGLTSTSFPETSELPEPYLHGYSDAEDGKALRDVSRSNPAVPWTSGAMVSTLADMRIWAEALADGTLLSAAIQRERLTWGVIPGEHIDLRYGLGVLYVNGLIGHNGGILGYSSWMVHAPEEGATIVVVTNRANTEGGTADSIFINIARMLFPDRFASLNATPTATPVS